MKKLNTKIFIEKAKLKHGKEKFNYDFVNYIKSNIKVKIVCKEHGEFEQTPASHLRGSRCPKCYGNIKLTQEEFINQSNLIHNFIYDYSLVEYINIDTKVKIICDIHGEFLQDPYNHLKGRKCKKCSSVEQGNKQKLSQEEFIKKAKLKHGNRYDYSLVEYKGSANKVKIICYTHGIFEQEAGTHLYQFCGCPNCGGTKLPTQEEVENHFKFEKCKLLDIYKNENILMKYICKCGKEAKITYSKFKMGRKCKFCGFKKQARKGSAHHAYNPDREQVALNKKIAATSRSLVKNVLKYTGKAKNTKTEKLLGYTRKELLEHLQKQSLYEEWSKSSDFHIDHLFPIIGFIEYNIFDPKIINSLDNLRILSAKENLIKHDKYDKQKFKQYLKNKGLIGEYNE